MGNRRMRRGKRVSTVVAFGLGCSALCSVDAAEKPAVLEEVIVTGIRASLTDSIEAKKADDHVAEVISADNLGQMPNVTVAESLVRLPGINGARDRGNESLATVRGLGPRLTMGTVNGREIASSEPNRNVRWEVFPTEVVSTVKVYKSQSADLLSGGVAGTIDIGTVRPLEYTGPSLVASAGAAYYDEGSSIPGYDSWGNRFGASWVGKVSDNLAFALGGTLQDQKNAYPSMGSWGYTDSTNAQDVDGDGDLDATPWGAATEVKQLDQERRGVLAAMQWRAGNVEMNLDGLYSKVQIDEKQNQTWFQGLDYSIFSAGNDYAAPGSSFTIIDGAVVAGTQANSFNRMDHVVAQYTEDKTLSAGGLNLAWRGDAWSVVADLSYSEAKRENIWQAVDLVSFPATTSFDWRESLEPTISVSSAALDGTPAPSWNGGAGQSAGPEDLSDEIGAAALSGSRVIDLGPLSGLDFGARYAERTKKHRYFSWNQAGSDAPLSAYDGLIPRYALPDLQVPTALNGNLQDLAQVAIGGFDPSLATEDVLARWKVEEETTEGFLRATFDADVGIQLKGNVGARVVHVKTTSSGFDQIAGVNTAATDGNSYTDVLPSATVNFIFDPEHILRFAAAKVLARPPLDELRTGRFLADPLSTVGQLTGSGANPNLAPFRANQFDLSYEWYFHSESLLAVALFTKSVKSIIGYKQGHETINGSDYLISGPFNGGGGYIDGVELTFQTPFYFWSGLENFGIYSNYAYVSSNLKEFVPANDPVELSGLAEHTGAVDLWYNNGPLEFRLGYKYHSPYTIIYGWNAQAVSRLQTENILDASASWQITDMIGVKLQVNNLTNEPLRAYFDNQVNRLANKDGSGGYQIYGRRYLLEVLCKF
jgi:iron complex outermembrane recepter protein